MLKCSFLYSIVIWLGFVWLDSRLNHHLTFYAAYKQSLKAEKNINVDDQIENLQKEGVMWNKVSLWL